MGGAPDCEVAFHQTLLEGVPLGDCRFMVLQHLQTVLQLGLLLVRQLGEVARLVHQEAFFVLGGVDQCASHQMLLWWVSSEGEDLLSCKWLVELRIADVEQSVSALVLGIVAHERL
jgi:hypothetical protein